MDYKELLRLMLEDTKQETLAEELQTSQATISRWLKDQEPRGYALERIREAAIRRNLIPGVVSGPGRAKPTGDVPNFNIHAGMGSGGALSVELGEGGESNQSVYPEDNDGFWSFPDSVRSSFRQLSQTYAMPVTGDSMEPTLQNGSYVFIDTSHTVPSPPDLYAVDYGDGLMVKRVELIPKDVIRVISDNDRYTTHEFHRQEVQVYGRVVAWFQWRG